MTDTKIDKADKTDINDSPAEDKAKLFNPIQLAGGALAAVTSAAVGSNLGVAGTLGGAAVASVVAGIAGALYTRGLENTRDGVKKIVLREPDGSTEVITVPDEGDSHESSLQTTAVLAEIDEPDAAATQGASVPSRATGTGTKQKSKWTRPLAIAGGTLVTAATTFVIAMGLITGWEASTGQTLDGQSGTTIGQKANRTSPTPSASTTPSASATPTASETATQEPTATPTTSEEPTATATEPSQTPTASETPTAQTETSVGADTGE